MIQITGWTVAILFLLLSLTAYYYLIIKPFQDAKNKHKQEAKERAEIDKIFSQSPTSFLQDGYPGFEQTEMMATTM